ncbi:fatty acyl-CoA reductase 1-like isoform X2 [Lineus longissimus]|uniref:fatty acyl-CoA reductase 1-like isoform X2 n=1 Tax=Lineus longissimus TaxID=88925 RepID=UPI002B4DE9EF
MKTISTMAASMSTPRIVEYYEDKTLFITGATGFIGKVLIEKLLRCCPGIRCIYLLLRPKKGKCVQERLTDMLNFRLFDRLKDEKPECFKKLIAIKGDVLETNLGISQADIQTLCSEVNVVFHSAATVKFDDSLRVSAEMNLLGVRKILKLCHQMTNLDVLVHVSTAYANCDQKSIKEVIYPPPIDPQKLIDALDWMDDEVVEALTPYLIRGKPNTYTFTKHLAENLLVDEAGDIPVAILRPSIVGAAWKEPLSGWVDNLNGPSGLGIAMGKGIMQYLFCDEKAVADIVPVDLPVNMLIAIGWYTAVHKPKEIHIYNCTTGTLNPISWGSIVKYSLSYMHQMPYEHAFRIPYCQTTDKWYLFEVYKFVYHMLPAYGLDLISRCMGKKPMMVWVYSKLHRSIDTLAYFTTRSWEWTNHNSHLLDSNMTADEQKMFYFDVKNLQWPHYMENYCLGGKLYLLKEKLADLQSAKDHYKLLRQIKYTVNLILTVIVWRFVMHKSKLARDLWKQLLAVLMRPMKGIWNAVVLGR